MGFCCLVEQKGCEQLVGYNYFKWFPEDGIEEIDGLIIKNEKLMLLC